MNLIATIAWRNIIRHRGKSIIIGIILFVGALLMTVGNGVVSGMDAGIKKNIVNGFLGDVVLISNKQKTDNILLNMMGTAIEPINTYPQIKQVLATLPFIERSLPAGKNLAMSLSEDGFQPGIAFLLGVDFAEYQKMFPGNFHAIEGRLLRPEEAGILVPVDAREELYNYSDTWLLPEGEPLRPENLSKDAKENLHAIKLSSSVVLMGMATAGNTSTDLRFGIKGIIKYNALNKIFGHFSITDIDSFRACFGYFPPENTVAVAKEEKKLLGMENTDMDAMFSADSMMVENTRKERELTITKSTETKTANKEDGVYNLVFIRLKDGTKSAQAVDQLNTALGKANTGVRAIPWNKAAGPIGSIAVIIKGALFLFVTLLFVVAVIIIINTLTMSALERTSEIGMMRAIGATKWFISGMFLGETAILAAVFGGAGVLVGIITVKVIPLLKITSTNDMVQMLYGGDIFHPLMTMPDILITVLQLIGVTVVAALYPASVARNITPLDAISRE